jgi:membrane protein implicated in regulation of membrane protease activity
MLGWIVLAIGCFLSRTLRLLPAIALALMSGLMIGVLKGSTWASAVQVAGLTVAFVPLGVTFLRHANRPSRNTVLWTIPLLLLFIVGSIVLGQLG